MVCFQTNQPTIDPEFVARIEAVVEEFGFSIEPQSRQGGESDFLPNHRSLSDFLCKADELANRMAPQTIDCADLIREDRDRL